MSASFSFFQKFFSGGFQIVMDKNKLLTLALEAGEIMLAAGAETHRVEDTMERILSTDKEHRPQAVVLSNSLFAGIYSDSCTPISNLKKITGRSTNLEKITRVNAMSRKFVEKKITMEEAFKELKQIRKLPSFSYPLTIFCYGMACAAFSPMFNGTFLDSAGAFPTGLALGILMLFLSKHNVSYFLSSLLGGVLITILSLFFYTIGLGNSYDKIIIGCIMPLVPGVTITNAIRDVMEGDFLCGTSKVIEAVLIAVAVASGVGMVLRIYNVFF